MLREMLGVNCSVNTVSRGDAPAVARLRWEATYGAAAPATVFYFSRVRCRLTAEGPAPGVRGSLPSVDLMLTALL